MIICCFLLTSYKALVIYLMLFPCCYGVVVMDCTVFSRDGWYQQNAMNHCHSNSYEIGYW